MNGKLEKYGPIIVFFIALILLVIHLFGFYPTNVTIDTTTILLLILLLIAPFASKLRKIKLGPFEAEIKTKEVEKIKKEVEKLPKVEQTDREKIYLKVEWIANDVINVLEYDHISALAKLRIELEKILKKIVYFTVKKEFRVTGVGTYLRMLQNKDVLESSLATSLGDVIKVCNRAIHGEEIKKQDAETIVELGLRLLDELYIIYDAFITEPFKKIKLAEEDVDEYFDSEYEVTTVVPIVGRPYINKRILTQEGLDALLEGYEEYAEFLVGIKKIEKKKKKV